MNTETRAPRALVHAPTQAAVIRARIIANAEGVMAALDTPHARTDSLTRICANTLHELGRSAPDVFQTLDSAILALARMQEDGWLYVRA